MTGLGFCKTKTGLCFKLEEKVIQNNAPGHTGVAKFNPKKRRASDNEKRLSEGDLVVTARPPPHQRLRTTKKADPIGSASLRDLGAEAPQGYPYELFANQGVV